MFLGEYAHSVDQKGRLAIPARFREALHSGLVLTRGLDRCVRAYPWEEWQTRADDLADRPPTRNNVRLNRSIFSSAFPVDVDAQGRILLPQTLREFAAIQETAVMIGMYRFFEIWSPATWTAEQDEMVEASWDLVNGREP